MDFELYRTTKEFCAEYGAIIGIAWSATFILFTEGLIGNNILYLTLAMGMTLICLAMPFYLAWRYKQHLTTPGDRVPVGIAFFFAIFMLIYACTITGVAQFLYFNFFDKGRLIEYFQATLSNPEVINQYKQLGAADILEQSRTQLQEVASLSPLELTLNLLANSILGSIVLSIPVAFVAHKKCTDMKAVMQQFMANKK